jgi:large subunit ribosomal protein L27e
LKKGKVVILLNGRFAGHKAVITHTNDQGTAKRPYGHAVVAGIDRYPLKVTNSMSKKKVYRRSRIRPFVKTVNYSHILPTRYSFEGDLPNLSGLHDPAAKKKAKGAVRSVFQKKYVLFFTDSNSLRHAEGKQKWFFAKLRF